jgi:GTP-binding protein Era
MSYLYELAVVIEEFRDAFEKDNIKKDTQISASILVNRPSQRAIVVGAKGSVIKQIGTNARKKIEAMVGIQFTLIFT